MSNSKAEKEKLQLIQEKSQQILSELLKDEDNKYCVDCDAKGPRWASWNLGVFLCIRCAGVHRNLGVHISKVKSVNLDSWSPEQVAYMQLMGNSKARAVYEANLPDNFKRPQADSGLEAFVRAKYEHKKYIAKEWVQPPTPKPAFDIEEERKKEKEKKKNKIVKGQTNATIVEVQTNPVPRPFSSPAGTAISAEKVAILTTSTAINNKNGTNGVAKPPSSDLLGLTTTSSSTSRNNSSDDDQFDAFVSCAPVSSNKTDDLVALQVENTSSTKTNEEEDFFNQKAPEQKKLDKESILKLYESSNLNNLSQSIQNNLFNLPSSTATTLQPMNIASNTLLNGFNSTPLIPSTANTSLANQSTQLANNLFNGLNSQSNVNGFANFNSPPVNQQQSFLAFNQATAAVQPTPINHNLPSTNPFLINPTPTSAAAVLSATTTNGTSTLITSDLFSSNLNTNLSTNLESQLNGLNLNTVLSDNNGWPTNNNATAVSVGQSLFSANFDNLNEKKINNGLINTPATNTSNPFLSSGVGNNNSTTTAIQGNTGLDIFSSFSSTTNTATNGLNDLNNDLDGWSAFHTSATNSTNTNSLTAELAWP